MAVPERPGREIRDSENATLDTGVADMWGKVVRILAFLGFCALMVGLFWVGAKPVAVGLFPPPIDKVVHFLTFSLITMLLWMSLLRGRPWLLVLVVASIGALDEFHQVFLPGRSAGVDDFLADFSAACLTGFLLARYHRVALAGPAKPDAKAAQNTVL